MKLWILFILPVIFFFASCIPALSYRSDYNAEGFNVKQLKGSSVRLYVNPTVDLLEFKVSFASEYKTEKKFISKFVDELKDTLSKSMIISTDSLEKIEEIFQEQLAPNQKDEKVRASLEKINEQYFIMISKIIISNSYNSTSATYSPGVRVSTPGGPMTVGGGMSGGGKIENCVVTINAEIWSVKEMKKVSRFSAFGDKGVFLFAFGTALKAAVNDAIINFCKYFKSN